MVHSSRLIEGEKRDRKTGQRIKKPETILEYNKYMKGVDHADQYLSYCPMVRKTKKWSKHTVLYLLNCALFNSFRVYKELNGKKIMYKKFLHKIASSWITDSSAEDPVSDKQEKNTYISPTGRTPKTDRPGRVSMDMKKHQVEKIIGINY